MDTLNAGSVSAMLPSAFPIVDKDWELADTYTLHFATDGAFDFDPGQMVMISQPGVGEVPISISSNPDVHDRMSLTIRGSGSVTRALGRLDYGDVVGIRGPYGTPWPLDTAIDQDLMIIAGGIGLAPLRSLIYRALARRSDFRNLTLLYGSRDPQSLLFERELHEWRGRFDMEVEITVDRSSPEWMGEVGLVTSLVDRARFSEADAVAMVCGPEIMMHFVGIALTDKGMHPDNIFFSMERNMKCGIGLCGHCQLGAEFLCKDGPVFSLSRIEPLMKVEEL
ncbi:MAG: FAD/NAD(P)-binding protein [Acidimicrobiia bacterium]|nr:FAD/NAD(P)-binding protein [Acidimicrobiia bacterium]MBT8250538.1 FAD/NAD(P)-binding protein [Acidimicrobiia bacterium]NNC42238.1 FAD/NAD(P)-binding protein [Acidimicrobiia bacterium]NND13593.1 FAD/NAD(P)-binding protein [Acidimicrobiia bacterium]NNL28702.1 FAD/NAD(P)-binding protein [Acidimicrobiia bacterium]